MHVIKMNEDKLLVTTVKATIFQHEKNADTLVFLIPKYYEEKNLADCSLLLRYILPSGVGKSEELEIDLEPYNKNFYRYHLKVTTRLTSEPGEIELWLSAIDIYDNIVLQSGTAAIEVTPAKDIVEYLAAEDLNQLDHLDAKVKELERTKADNVTFNTEDSMLQLSAQGKPIGDSVYIPNSGGGPGIVGAEITENGELLITYADGTADILGTVVKEGAVYVPHISPQKILSFTIEEEPGEIPEPVDLNPHDEWSSVDDSKTETDYVWEEME